MRKKVNKRLILIYLVPVKMLLGTGRRSVLVHMCGIRNFFWGTRSGSDPVFGDFTEFYN